MPTSLTRIGVFYDGNYFTHVSNYYNYVHPRKSRLSLTGIHRYIRERIAQLDDIGSNQCKIVESHFFKGRITASEASEKGNQLYFDRVFEDILAYEGVQSHYQPTKGTVNSRSADKGLNLQLAIEVMDVVYNDKVDIVVLIGADGDYAPLLRKVSATGVRSMLLSWDFEFTNDDGKRMTTRTSQDLLNEVTYPTLMHDRIEEGLDDNADDIQNLFVLPPVDQREPQPNREQREERRSQESTSLDNSDAQLGESHESEILTLKTGYGFVRFEPNNLFFHHSSLINVDFNDLFEGDSVRFIVEENDKGELVAKEVELLD